MPTALPALRVSILRGPRLSGCVPSVPGFHGVPTAAGGVGYGWPSQLPCGASGSLVVLPTFHITLPFWCGCGGWLARACWAFLISPSLYTHACTVRGFFPHPHPTNNTFLLYACFFSLACQFLLCFSSLFSTIPCKACIPLTFSFSCCGSGVVVACSCSSLGVA